MNRRETIAAASKAMKEKNDCAVRAVAVVTGLDYEVVHAAYKRHGRRARCGAYTHTTFLVLSDLGYKLKDMKVKAKTIRSLQQTRELPLFGTFLVRSTRHMTGVVDRAYLDWAATSCKRIRQVWEVVKR